VSCSRVNFNCNNNNNNNNNDNNNVTKKEAEKILKCEDLVIEIQFVWNVKEKVIPVITGRLESFQNHSDSTIQGQHEMKEIQNHLYWALHTNCGKWRCGSTKHSVTGEITLPVAHIVDTGQLQLYVYIQ
jgi:hypothetical protein